MATPDRVPPPGWALVPGIAGPVLVSAGVLLAGIATPGYDPLRRTVSALAIPGYPYAPVVGVMIALLGGCVAWSAWPLLRAHHGARWAAVALVAAGAGLVALAIVTREAHSGPRTRLHQAIAAVTLLVFAATPALLALGLRHVPNVRRLSRASLVAATASVALLAMQAALVGAGHFPGGAWERAFVAVDLLWLIGMQVSLLRPRLR